MVFDLYFIIEYHFIYFFIILHITSSVYIFTTFNIVSDNPQAPQTRLQPKN